MIPRCAPTLLQCTKTDDEPGFSGFNGREPVIFELSQYYLNKFGLVVVWDLATANIADNIFQPVIRSFED
jgi:hypothetical protein